MTDRRYDGAGAAAAPWAWPVRSCRAGLGAMLCTAIAPSAALAAGMAPVAADGGPPLWTFATAFTFLFVTLGPLNILVPFWAMTEGQDRRFKVRLAFRAVGIAAVALLVAATVGAATLGAWGISPDILLVAAGLLLFLVALRGVIAGYAPPAAAPGAPRPAPAGLAISPLTFPTIVTPYGLALLVLLCSLNPLASGGLWVLSAAAAVLGLDLAAMLAADRLVRTPFVKPGLDILGAVMNILLVALGLQAVADGLRLVSQAA